MPVQLCDLYENDCIFDKFNCCMSGAGDQVATGTYNNQLKLMQKDGMWPSRSETSLEATRDPMRKRVAIPKVCSLAHQKAFGQTPTGEFPETRVLLIADGTVY